MAWTAQDLVEIAKANGFVLAGRSCSGTVPRLELEALVRRGVFRTGRNRLGEPAYELTYSSASGT